MTRQRALREPYFEDEDLPAGFFAGVGELVAAYPSIAGGSAAFAVIFAFVSANALWYQPGKHPAPILQTRPPIQGVQNVATPDEQAIREALADAPARDVSSYRIERDETPSTGSIPVPTGRPGAETAALAPAGARTDPPQTETPAADPLLSEIQSLLKHKGFYGGEVDGLMGPMSAAAIRNWQKKAGMEITGTPSEQVLESLKIGGRPDPIVPRQNTAPPKKPAPVAAPAPAAAPAPVKKPTTIEEALAAATPEVPAARPAAGPMAEVDDDLVRRIQAGLSNIAYADIAIDGYAGEQTRQAIAAFEKHYRLPVTGQPNEAVLEKLLEIGAL